jgi:hypothetical protein
MPYVSAHRPVPLLALLLAAGLPACTAERVSAPDDLALEAHRTRQHGSARRSNRERYRDRGRPRAWGHSLFAGASADAFVNGDGSVSLEVTSFAAGAPGIPAGIITKLQVKVIGAAGNPLATLNISHLSANPVVAAIPAIPAGGSVSVLVHVTGIAGRRTEVVRITGITPALRPDLAVTDVDAPLQMVVGQPAVVSATVTELHGQRGASANCVLYVNEARVDGATAIWVDAGDAVTCAFTTTFWAAGDRTLRVAVEQVIPGDADPSNNAASLTVGVADQAAVQPGNFAAYGEVRDGDLFIADSAYTRWTDRATGRVTIEQANGFHGSGRTQSAFISATVGEALPLPLERLEVAMSSGGRLLHAQRWSAFGAGAAGDPSCASAFPGGGFSVFVCSYTTGGFTTIQYALSAGSVTYQSTEYNRTWNGATYDESTWMDNYLEPAVPVTPQVLGADFAFHVAATTGGATYGFGASGPLGPISESDVQPLTCSSFVLTGPPDYDILACGAFSWAFTGIAGALNGSGYLSRSPVMP